MSTGFYESGTGLVQVDYSGEHPRVVARDLTPRDEQILTERLAALDALEGPRVGDYVTFADGMTRRFAYDWDWEHGIQTTDGGSFYLGRGYMSMSGSLHRAIPHDTLRLTDETRDGPVWFFHHDWHKAHNAVEVEIPLRVYACTLASTE